MAEEILDITLRKDPALQQLLLDMQIALKIKRELLAGLDPKDIAELREKAIDVIITQDKLKEGEISLTDFITQHKRADELIEERAFVWAEEQTKLLEFEGQAEDVIERTDTKLADGQIRLTDTETRVEALDAKIEGVMAKQVLLTDFKGEVGEIGTMFDDLEEKGVTPEKIPYLFFTIRRLTQQIPILRNFVYWMGQARLAERLAGAGGPSVWIAGVILGYNLLVTAQRIIANIRREEERYKTMIMERRGLATRAEVDEVLAEMTRASQQRMRPYT